MESTINSMIPYAIACITGNTQIKQGEKVEGIYESYLSQFGPMVIQLGMRSTLAVYQNKAGSSKGNRGFILDLIYKTLQDSHFMNFSAENVRTRSKWIDSYLRQTSDISSNDEQLILDASVALKRAIRTFSLTDDKQE